MGAAGVRSNSQGAWWPAVGGFADRLA